MKERGNRGKMEKEVPKISDAEVRKMIMSHFAKYSGF